MKYPCLVRKKDCKTAVSVRIESEEMTEDGGPVILLSEELMCNYQDTARRTLTKEQKLIQISGTALFPGDIAPDVPAITGGTLTVFGIERRILQGMKARNPDGSVNYTRLDVI